MTAHVPKPTAALLLVHEGWAKINYEDLLVGFLEHAVISLAAAENRNEIC